MKKNMGNTDRIIRVIVAAVIAGLYYTNIINGTGAVLLLVLAVIFVLTSFLGCCPLYSLLGIQTCRNKKVAQ
jgi:hypothetical protein